MARLSIVAFAAFIISCSCIPTGLVENRGSCTKDLASFVYRADWGGRPPTQEPDPIGFPAPFVVIHHTYIPDVCHTLEECKASMRSMQSFHQDTNGWADIGYNFAIGGEGSIFEGRGWDAVGAHAVGVNSRSVGIALIGDFVSKLPSRQQLDGVKQLINAGLALGYIDPNYRLIGHRNVSPTECPGQALFDEISTWDRFYSGTVTA